MRTDISKQEVLKFFHSALLLVPFDLEKHTRKIKVIEHLIDKYCKDDDLLVKHPVELYDNHIFICQMGVDHLESCQFEVEHLEDFYNKVLSSQQGIFINNHRLELYAVREILDKIKENPSEEDLTYDYRKEEYQKTHTTYNLM